MILSELIKIILLFIIFSILGNIKLFIFSLIVLTTTRSLVGGFHAKGFWGCFSLSLFFFLTTYFVTINFADIIYMYRIPILIVCQLIFIIKAPVASEKKPIYTKERYRTLKLSAIVITLCWTMVLIFAISDIYLSSIGTITIVLQTIQLVVRKNHLLFKGGQTNEKV